MSLKQLDHCAPDNNSPAAHLMLNDVFTVANAPGNQRVETPPGDCTVSVNWVARCFATAGDDPESDVFELVLTWLQRHKLAKIWTDSVTVLPVNMMLEVSTMHYLFEAYCDAMIVSMNIAEPWPDTIFHPKIDLKRFMDASIPVMQYIMEHEDLFEKPYIAFLMQADSEFLRSCVVTVNAGMLNDVQSVGNVAGLACGFLNCDANEKCGDSRLPPQCLFFLMLAYTMIKTHQHAPKSSMKKMPIVLVDMKKLPHGFRPWMSLLIL
jgi:hypothetical protein